MPFTRRITSTSLMSGHSARVRLARNPAQPVSTRGSTRGTSAYDSRMERLN
jgi:hypothetical protein